LNFTNTGLAWFVAPSSDNTADITAKSENFHKKVEAPDRTKPENSAGFQNILQVNSTQNQYRQD
jgi:hypothetical protein